MQKQIDPATGKVVWTGVVIQANGNTFKVICRRDPKEVVRDMVTLGQQLLGIGEVQE
jgi:hypothetical protein